MFSRYTQHWNSLGKVVSIPVPGATPLPCEPCCGSVLPRPPRSCWLALGTGAIPSSSNQSFTDFSGCFCRCHSRSGVCPAVGSSPQRSAPLQGFASTKGLQRGVGQCQAGWDHPARPTSRWAHPAAVPSCGKDARGSGWLLLTSARPGADCGTGHSP